MSWIASFHWHMSQFPSVLVHLRDQMNPLQATDTESVRVSGGSDPRRLPFRLGAASDVWTPMEEADHLWAELVWFGSVVAQHLGDEVDPAPGVFTHAWMDNLGNVGIQPGESIQDTGNLASAAVSWLRRHADSIETLPVDDITITLFGDLRALMVKYRMMPRRLRTSAERCGLCGGIAVRAEWEVNARGDVDVTKQCTRCHERYEPPTRVPEEVVEAA